MLDQMRVHADVLVWTAGNETMMCADEGRHRDRHNLRRSECELGDHCHNYKELNKKEQVEYIN
jgi:hypothetical protein